MGVSDQELLVVSMLLIGVFVLWLWGMFDNEH
jgi:hypothetical protein